MSPRLDYYHASPAATKAMMALQAAVNHAGLDHKLMELVKLRASRINGCAYCIDMHTKDALAAGETAQRLFLLDAWHKAPCYTERERAALLWTDTLTLVAEKGVPDDVFAEVHAQFNDEELVNLTLAIVAINGWNRFSISFRPVVGEYQPAGKTRPVKPLSAGATA